VHRRALLLLQGPQRKSEHEDYRTGRRSRQAVEGSWTVLAQAMSHRSVLLQVLLSMLLLFLLLLLVIRLLLLFVASCCFLLSADCCCFYCCGGLPAS
jgi:hypothetical protein